MGRGGRRDDAACPGRRGVLAISVSDDAGGVVATPRRRGGAEGCREDVASPGRWGASSGRCNVPTMPGGVVTTPRPQDATRRQDAASPRRHPASWDAVSSRCPPASCEHRGVVTTPPTSYDADSRFQTTYVMLEGVPVAPRAPATPSWQWMHAAAGLQGPRPACSTSLATRAPQALQASSKQRIPCWPRPVGGGGEARGRRHAGAAARARKALCNSLLLRSSG